MPEDTQPTVVARILGAEKGNYEGTDYYTLGIRLGESVGDISGIGSFDFSQFKDKDVLLTLELRKSAGRFKARAISAELLK